MVGDMRKSNNEPLLKAIRKKCLSCSGGLQREVINCQIEDCPLFPFMVINPENLNPAEKRQRI